MVTKRKKMNDSIAESTEACSLDTAIDAIKKGQSTKFDSSVDLQLSLGADPNASDQVIRGTAALPHGTGKKLKVIVLSKDESGEKAKEAGADEVGGDDLIEKIMKGWMDFDVVVAAPAMMRDIAKLGRVLGPRGLMPSPKAGTVTENVAEAVKEIKKGRVEYKMDKQSNLHLSIGRLSFSKEQLLENGKAIFASIINAKPKSLKGDYLKSAHISSTMGPGIKIDLKTLGPVEST